MHCLLKWLDAPSSNETCPMDRRPWENASGAPGAPGSAGEGAGAALAEASAEAEAARVDAVRTETQVVEGPAPDEARPEAQDVDMERVATGQWER